MPPLLLDYPRMLFRWRNDAIETCIVLSAETEAEADTEGWRRTESLAREAGGEPIFTNRLTDATVIRLKAARGKRA